MQLMPDTARRTAKRSGVEFDLARLLEPTYNAQLGAAHLGELMQDWKGSHILMFASYNAGGGNVSKWIKAYGDPRSPDIDPIDWVERIPFSETRNYVQRVLEGLLVYRHRLLAAIGAPTTTKQACSRPTLSRNGLSAREEGLGTRANPRNQDAGRVQGRAQRTLIAGARAADLRPIIALRAGGASIAPADRGRSQ